MVNAKYNFQELCYDLCDIFNMRYRVEGAEVPSCHIEQISMPHMCFKLFSDNSDEAQHSDDEYQYFMNSWAKPHNLLSGNELYNFVNNIYSLDYAYIYDEDDRLEFMDLLYPFDGGIMSSEYILYYNDFKIHEYFYKAICALYDKINPYPWLSISSETPQNNDDKDDFYIYETKKRLLYLVVHVSACSNSSNNRGVLLGGRTDKIVPTDSLQKDFEKIISKHDRIIMYNVAFTGKSTFCKQYVSNHERSYYCNSISDFSGKPSPDMFPDLEIWDKIGKTTGHEDLADYNPYQSSNVFNGFTIFIDNIKDISSINPIQFPTGCNIVYIYDGFINNNVIYADTNIEFITYKFTNISYRKDFIETACIDNKASEELQTTDIKAAARILSLQSNLGDLLAIYKLYGALYRQERKTKEAESPTEARNRALKTLSYAIADEAEPSLKELPAASEDGNPPISFASESGKPTKKAVKAHLKSLLGFLNGQEQEILLVLYRLSLSSNISPKRLSQYLFLYDPNLEKFNLRTYFDKLNNLGWIQGSDFLISKHIVDALSYSRSKKKIDLDDLTYYLCFAMSVTHTMRGLSKVHIEKDVIYNLIFCLHNEFKERIFSKTPYSTQGQDYVRETLKKINSNSIIDFFYIESIYFCDIYPGSYTLKNGDIVTSLQLSQQLLDFVKDNKQYFIIDKSVYVDNNARDELNYQHAFFYDNRVITNITSTGYLAYNMGNVVLKSLLDSVLLMFNHIKPTLDEKLKDKNHPLLNGQHHDSNPFLDEYIKTRTHPLLNGQHQDNLNNHYPLLINLLNHYISDATYLLYNIIYAFSLENEELIKANYLEMNRLIALLVIDVTCFRGTEMGPSTFYSTYIDVIGVLIHSFYMLRSIYPDEYNIEADNEIRQFERNDISFNPDMDALILCQQLLIANKIYSYCQLRSNQKIASSTLRNIENLVKRCGDLPDSVNLLCRLTDAAIAKYEKWLNTTAYSHPNQPVKT